MVSITTVHRDDPKGQPYARPLPADPKARPYARPHPASRKISLRAARINSGLTQRQAAALLGISEQTLSNYERGFSYPDVSRMQQMMELYQMDYSAIRWTLPTAPKRGVPARAETAQAAEQASLLQPEQAEPQPEQAQPSDV